jgi:hypothetical protein
MGYVDLRTRRREDARRRQDPGSLWEYLVANPYLAIAVGLGVLASWIALSYLFEDGLSAAVLMLALILTVVLLSGETWQLQRRRSESARPRFGGEKQLLIAIRDAGSITPIEAALETSLTVDEAEEILTRLADRGHLLVESNDGALFYALPGKRSSREVH